MTAVTGYRISPQQAAWWRLIQDGPCQAYGFHLQCRVHGPLDPAELSRRLPCPRCRKRMDTHPYHGGGNAVIDTCHRCRLVWLDAGEITVLGNYSGRRGSPVVEPPPAPAVTPAAAPTPRPVITIFGFPITIG